MDEIVEFDYELELMDVGLTRGDSWDVVAAVAAMSGRVRGKQITAEQLKILYPRWADIAYGVADI